jgi:photosystem II stability/assembly factor-like uncharacterized protein
MTTRTPLAPESGQPELVLPPVTSEDLDALIKEARRRTRRRRAGYVLVAVLAGLTAAGVVVGLLGGTVKRPAASGGGGAEGAKTSVGAQPRFDPQSVSFVSPEVGWAWGPGIRWLGQGYGPGVLARTNDGGRLWSVIPTPGIDYSAAAPYPEWASGVRFVDRTHGYLFGGELYATADGGRNWTTIRSPNSIFDLEVGAGRAYAVMASCRVMRACTEAYLYRLEDGGRRFIRIGPTSPIGPGTGLLAVHGQSVYLLAPPPAYRLSSPIPLWVSTDGGRTWLRRLAPCHGQVTPDTLAAWSTSGLALACGGQLGAGNQEKTFYRSTDGGAHWRLTGRIPGPPLLDGMSGGYIASLAAAGRDTWALGEARGTLLITNDAGRTWQPAAFTGTPGPVEGWGYVNFTDPSHAVAVPWTLNGSVLAFTTNAGRDWSETSFPTPRSQ